MIQYQAVTKGLVKRRLRMSINDLIEGASKSEKKKNLGRVWTILGLIFYRYLNQNQEQSKSGFWPTQCAVSLQVVGYFRFHGVDEKQSDEVKPNRFKRKISQPIMTFPEIKPQFRLFQILIVSGKRSFRKIYFMVPCVDSPDFVSLLFDRTNRLPTLVAWYSLET